MQARRKAEAEGKAGNDFLSEQKRRAAEAEEEVQREEVISVAAGKEGERMGMKGYESVGLGQRMIQRATEFLVRPTKFF